MRTPASIAYHPIRRMIVPIAITGFAPSSVFDIVGMITGSTDLTATLLGVTPD